MSDSSDYEEDLGLLKKALDVELPDDFDPNKIPQNGIEYLQSVMYEAKQCKQLVVADIDKRKVKDQTCRIDVKEECLKAPFSMMPTQEWQENVIEDFTKLRNFISNKTKNEPTCNINEACWVGTIRNTTPSFTDVINLTQLSKDKILLILSNELKKVENGEGIPYKIGIWIYSILATLDIPLNPETCHNLRELARRCSVIRSKLSPDCSQEIYTPCNLFICVVARYFKQLDLADNENDMF